MNKLNSTIEFKNSPITDCLFSRKEAADYLNVAAKTLAIWSSTKRYDLPFIKIGRLVKYKRSDLDAFIQRNTFQNTKH
jgi:excisionase family DNA binding protein